MRLKEIRKAAGFTQKQIAEKIGIGQNTYSYWENGKTKIDNVSVAKLASIFNVSIDQILGHDVGIEKKERDDAALEKMFEDDKDTLRFIKDNQISFDGEIYDLSDEGFLMLKNAILLAIREVKNAE